MKQILTSLEMNRKALLGMGDRDGLGRSRRDVLDDVDALLDELLEHPKPWAT